ncbi:MAG: hypothetical protein ACHBN1_18680 [Heteroscytonema crispum UTEX LB 1556]
MRKRKQLSKDKTCECSCLLTHSCLGDYDNARQTQRINEYVPLASLNFFARVITNLRVRPLLQFQLFGYP